MSEQLRKVQLIQLEMALEFKRICDKHNIKYFIFAGTLLGAVRHKGFIPWDDDMDIGMIREEYDKFIKVCKEELSDRYFLQTAESDKAYAMCYGKIRANGTKFVEKYVPDNMKNNGVFIDIFPLDNVPNSIIKQNLQEISSKILKTVIYIKAEYKFWENATFKRRSIYNIVKLISAPISLNRSIKMLDYVSKIGNKDRSQYIVAIGGCYGYKKETLKIEWAEDLVYMDFEGEKFLCPKNYDEYLTWLYGDYMTPPPESNRYIGHGIVDINLGEYRK